MPFFRPDLVILQALKAELPFDPLTQLLVVIGQLLGVPAFRRGLAQSVLRLTGGLEEQPLQIDAYVPLADLTLELVADLERLAPFGPGNQPLLTRAWKPLQMPRTGLPASMNRARAS